MGRTTSIAAVALLAALPGSADAIAETTHPLTIHAQVVDEVGFPATALRHAQEEASRIFEAAGITVAWLPAGDMPAGTLIIKIVSTPLGRGATNPNVLGIASDSKEIRGHVAWLYYHRIQNLAAFFNLEVSLMLGHVMAHEMGHLLLPYGSHSAAGLMKAGWDTRQAVLASVGALTFDRDEAATIRARLKHTRETARELLIPNPESPITSAK